jgi:hypothetical protein
MKWKTHLVVFFKPTEKISEVIKKIESVGFKSALGPVDFEYIWNEEPKKEEVIELADKLCGVLKDNDLVFNIDTHSC